MKEVGWPCSDAVKLLAWAKFSDWVLRAISDGLCRVCSKRASILFWAQGVQG